MRQKYYKQKQKANVDLANNVTTQWNTSYQHATYRQIKQHIVRHDRVCSELHCNICKEIGVKLDST